MLPERSLKFNDYVGTQTILFSLNDALIKEATNFVFTTAAVSNPD